MTTDEPTPTGGERDASSSWTAFISYVDAKGDHSERRFTCHSLSGFGDTTHVTGYCHERRAVRMFRVDRIVEMVCAESGEVLDPGSHFDWLRETGALRVQDKALVELGRILVFLARCDGSYHPLEQSALGDIISRYVLRFGGDDGTIEAAVAGTRRLAPDGEDLVASLRKFSRAPNRGQLCRFVLDSGAAMIDADGRHSPEEMAWAVEVSSALKAACQR